MWLKSALHQRALRPSNLGFVPPLSHETPRPIARMDWSKEGRGLSWIGPLSTGLSALVELLLSSLKILLFFFFFSNFIFIYHHAAEIFNIFIGIYPTYLMLIKKNYLDVRNYENPIANFNNFSHRPLHWHVVKEKLK